MTIDTRVIRAEPHVEVGSVILRDAVLLVEHWCRRAVEEQPNAKRVHYDVLRDHFPAFLEAMGRSLIQAGDPEPIDDSTSESAEDHGEQRWDSGWSLTELVRDYQLLKLVILQHLEEALARPVRYREVMAVGVLLDDAIAASIVAYTKNRDEDLRKSDRDRVESLAEVNRNKDEFIAGLAHELRSPLAPIVNSVKVLQLLLGSADSTVIETISVVERQAKQLSRLVDDLLDLSRIAQGQLELRKQHVDLRSVLDQAVQMSDPLVKAREHRLTVRLPAEPIFVEADPERLVQVVVNLLNNAAKYTERGGELRLTAGRLGGEVVISVGDNGMGIPPEMTARVFEMFVQVDRARLHSQGGLGIGLTLVKRLVALHGGTIECNSEGLGKGSEFTIRLPSLAASSPPARAKPSPQPVESRHVLIIEDHADARESLAKLLRLTGHRVDVAESGAAGIDQALASCPQAVLVDIGLPDVSGYEVARRLRKECGDGLTLIALTGYGQSEDLQRALDAGFDAHLVKPTNLEQLGRVLARAAARGHRGSAE